MSYIGRWMVALPGCCGQKFPSSMGRLSLSSLRPIISTRNAPRCSRWPIRHGSCRVSTYGLTLLSVGNYFTKAEMPRLLLSYFWVFATLLLVIQKYSTSRLIRDWKSLTARQRRVLICGTTRETRRLFSYLLHSPHLGQIPVGFLDESGFDNRRVIYSHDYNLKHHVPVISEPLSESLLRSLDVQEIFIPPTVSQPRMNELLALAAAAGVRVSLVGAGHPYFAEHCTSVQMIDGLMVTTFDADGDHPLPYIAFKRCTDLLLASLLMLLTLPMWLVAAAMVKADFPRTDLLSPAADRPIRQTVCYAQIPQHVCRRSKIWALA